MKPVRVCKIFLTICLLVGFSPTTHHLWGSEMSVNQELRSLTHILEDFGKRYEVFFSYEASLLKDVKVDFEFRASESMGDAIERLLAKTNLKFDVYGDKYFVIYEASKRARQDAKRILKKFKQIDKLQERGAISVQQNIDSPQAKLTSIVKGVAEIKSEVAIQGVITDEEGNALIGATVLVKGTTNGTVTDFDGRFDLSIPDGDVVLVISYTGYSPKEVAVSGQTNLEITLTQAEHLLEQVVVVGYGTQKSQDVTTSVAKMSIEQIEDRTGVVSRVDQALVGAMAGVRVQEVSGQPGRALSVRVRGTGTITAGAEPLYVIDGIPISGSLDNIALGNIESIEVLKDAAAASIYGSRGANGVVLITTQQGSSGKPVISFKTRTGFQQVAETYDVLNRDEWISFAVEERNNTYLLNGGDPSVPYDERPGGSRINPEWITNPEKFPDTDWQDLISQTAPIHNSQFTVSGGSERTTYNIYADVFLQEGVIKHTDYNRYSLRANVESKLSDRIRVGMNISPSFSIQNESDAENVGGPISRAKFLAPIVEPHLATVETGPEPYTRTDILTNPLAWLQEVDDETKRFRTLASVYGEVRLFDLVNLRNTASIDLMNARGSFYQTNNVNRDRGSFARSNNSQALNLLNETLLSYDMESGDHSLSVIAGFSVQKFQNESSSLEGRGFPDDLVKTLNAATELTAGSSFISENSLLSYFSRVNYNYKHKYLFTASIRRDGSSRFGQNNKWGWFPSASLGWRLSDEGFFQDINSLSDLKLRASYGVTGNNNVPDYGYIGSLSQTNYVLGDGNGSLAAGLSPSSFSNPDLSWEKNNTLDIGLDVGFLENRFTLSFDYYRSITDDLLLNVPIPSITGFTSSLQNIGKVENKGFELELGAHIISTANFKWKMDGNIAYNKNEVLELGPSGSPIPGFARSTTVAITMIGHPIGSYYLIPTDGVFTSEEELASSPVSKIQNVGDLKYVDTNGDGEITNDDKTIVGKNQPDYIWGLNQRIEFKNFDLSALLYGEWGNQLINESQGGAGRSHVGNVLGYWRDRYVSAEDPGNGTIPRAAVTANLTTPSDFWMFNASFWRVRNITLGYTVPSLMLDRIGGGLSSARIYLSAENVFTKDDYFGTPQTGTRNNSVLTPGIDATNTYPLAKSLVLGINLSF